MKSISSLILSSLISFLFIACNSLSEREQMALDTLGQEFPEYEFSKLRDLSDAYLKLRLKEETRLDSMKLRSVYEELLNIRKGTIGNGQSFVNWIYLVIYDKDDKYVFTIVENNEKVIFFRDGSN